MKQILYSILAAFGILAILVGIWWMTSNQTSDQQDSDISVRNFTRYTNEELGFEILRPSESSVNIEGPQNRRVKFTLLGENNEPNTEITDGFTFTVFSDPVATNRDTQNYAESYLNEIAATSEIVDELEEVIIDENNYYRFSHTSMLGTTVDNYTLTRQNQAFVISTSVSGTSTDEYEAMVESMLGSFEIINSDNEPASQTPTSFNSVKLAVLDRENTTNGQQRGCDTVVMIDRQVSPPTTSPLTTALSMLFNSTSTEISGYHNFIAQTNDTLSFDRVRVENGTAHVYLNGELSGLAGVCDNPRAKIQIEETARQFSTVNNVQIYLNGQVTELQPSFW